MNSVPKNFKIVTLIIVIITIVLVWVILTYNNLRRENDLCKHGGHTWGHVSKVEDTNDNEGNIHSWDVYYYFNTNSERLEGKINERKIKIINIGDSVQVTYFTNNPSDHEAKLSTVMTECKDFSFGTFIRDNWVILTIGVIGIILFSFKLSD
jgi:hypothetical protein